MIWELRFSSHQLAICLSLEGAQKYDEINEVIKNKFAYFSNFLEAFLLLAKTDSHKHRIALS